jgi:hypothetical protein
MPVVAAGEFRFIGKETNRRLEEEDDIVTILEDSELEPLEYRRGETKSEISDPVLKDKSYGDGLSIKTIALESGVSRKTVNNLRAGKRIRKSTARKIYKAIDDIQREERRKQLNLEKR